MEIWLLWWGIVTQLRPAFSHRQTFLWFCACLAGMSIRSDTAGVTSFVRALGISGVYYDRMLDCFHSRAVDRALLVKLWVKAVLGFGLCHMINGRLLLIGDGIKAPKEGKKMPAVKFLHQESESNSKPEFIMGHSCQALALCCRAASTFFAVPLCVRIHEGLIFSNRDRRTLMDKMVQLISSLTIGAPCYLIADAYYAAGKIARFLLKNGDHLITRVRSNAVAYQPPQLPRHRGRGRPKKYGKKLRLKKLFEDTESFTTIPSPIPAEKNVAISYRSMDLLWKPVAKPVQFVLIIHPLHGRTIYMTTDLNLNPEELLSVYALRFKIEVSFRNAIHTIGAYAYHFWMKAMTPIRRGTKNQYLHKQTQQYRDSIIRKMDAYHLHLQLGAIAQGILNYIAVSAPTLVWAAFRSWIRTIRPGIPPSEAVTNMALRNTFHEFLFGIHQASIFTKFIVDKLDPYQSKALQLGECA